MHVNDLVAVEDTTVAQLQTYFEVLRRVTRILIRHARNLCRMRCGKALLRLIYNETESSAQNFYAHNGRGNRYPFPTY